jgi:serine/threonine protein kinase
VNTGQSATPARIGKYEVLKPLAQGGMAELFLARATGLVGIERLVVIKRVRPQLATYQKYIAMFLDEARLAATLQHANIVQTYDFGEDYGGYYIAMEYLHGEDVARLMKTAVAKRVRVPLEHALSIGLGMCAGLHYAHERVALDGQPLYIVHRDISPHNISVTYDGSVKVVDFGIAKAARRLIETRNRTIKGKIPYMSPEQCLGGAIDRRSDVFSVSIVLWELTLGRRLFDPKSPLGLLKAVANADVPTPSSIEPDYPPELEAILMKGLSLRVEDRFQTAEELQLALEAFAREQRLPVSPVGLARYMRELFSLTVDAWRAAQYSGGQAFTGFVLNELEKRHDAEHSGTHNADIDDSAGQYDEETADHSLLEPAIDPATIDNSAMQFELSMIHSAPPLGVEYEPTINGESKAMLEPGPAVGFGSGGGRMHTRDDEPEPTRTRIDAPRSPPRNSRPLEPQLTVLSRRPPPSRLPRWLRWLLRIFGRRGHDEGFDQR